MRAVFLVELLTMMRSSRRLDVAEVLLEGPYHVGHQAHIRLRLCALATPSIRASLRISREQPTLLRFSQTF